ncbi:hypothetical protein UA08_09509 [Talaromyces atroroseus]|uniref:Uncharacterized protein n=1 Tax=Talaromyces atroroseus TaxID=1441469 RepID=A0A1Q5Q5X9_TALAT|nr:hypothetical protein UA08_09509 [Talaromyces atroroseus]OKL55224.1 hypothetical protein UA08_09509 [Talaromyces atroroseus]
MDAHRSIEDYQHFLVELYETLEQQLDEAKKSAEVQQEAMARRHHFTLKTVEGPLLTICLSSDSSVLRIATQDDEFDLISAKRTQ